MIDSMNCLDHFLKDYKWYRRMRGGLWITYIPAALGVTITVRYSSSKEVPAPRLPNHQYGTPIVEDYTEDNTHSTWNNFVPQAFAAGRIDLIHNVDYMCISDRGLFKFIKENVPTAAFKGDQVLMRYADLSEPGLYTYKNGKGKQPDTEQRLRLYKLHCRWDNMVTQSTHLILIKGEPNGPTKKNKQKA